MDAGYSMLSGDLDVCRMFDQYSYKVSRFRLFSQSAKKRPMISFLSSTFSDIKATHYTWMIINKIIWGNQKIEEKNAKSKGDHIQEDIRYFSLKYY